RKAPGCSLPRVKGCIDGLSIAWIENHVTAASPRIMRRARLQNELPRFAAVSCFVEAALATVCPQMSHRRDVSDVRIFRIDNDACNRPTVFQPDVCPMFAAVGRSIYAIAPIGGIAVVRFAASDPNDIRIRRRNCNRASRKRGLFVEN